MKIDLLPFVGATTTLVHVGDRSFRLLQVQRTPHGPELLTLKTAPTATLTPETLKALVRTLPTSPGRILLTLSKAQVLTRGLTLPADDPGELATMARYALADHLPYALEECVVAVQAVRVLENKTQVLAAIVPHAILDRLLGLLAPAGLTPQAIALSSEGLARWHRTLVPDRADGACLVLETLENTLELAIVDGEHLVSVRSLPLPASGDLPPAWLLTQVQETLQGYAQERIGPPVTTITVGGPPLSTQGLVAMLSEHLNLSVTVADPTASPFTQALAHQAEDLTALSWSDLFGLALAPMITLDLLPAEVRQAQAQAAVRRHALAVIAWLGMCVWLGAAIGGIGLVRHLSRQQALAQEHAKVEASATRAARLARYLEQIATTHAAYAATVTLLTDLQSAVPAAVVLEQVTLDTATLTVTGTAPALSDVTAVIEQLQRHPALRAVTLQRATADRRGHLHFTVEAQR